MRGVRSDSLANVAALSPYYFQRLFRQSINISVDEYVRLRKLARAGGKRMSL